MLHSFTQITLNYLLIQFSIILFIVPFYLVYKYYHPETKFEHLALNEHIGSFLSSNQANFLIFTWAALEAICWFVIPEFLLLLVIFLKVSKKGALLFWDILGTGMGTMIGILLSLYTHFDVVRVPYITQSMVLQVAAWYKQLGVFGLFFQPFSGVPYKVFVLNAHQFHLNLLGFILLAIIIRIGRYYLFYLVFVGLYPFLHRLVSKNYIPIFVLSCFIFSVLFLKVYKSYGQEYVVNIKGAEAIHQTIQFFAK